jgi:protein AroM
MWPFMHKVGFLTIGQSPREDIMVEMRPLLMPSIEVVEYGLLDDLNPGEIDALAPHEQETHLVSRLRNGTQVFLSERKISELLSKAIDYLIGGLNVEAVGVLCTHEFQKKKLPFPVIFPSEQMKSHLDKISYVYKLGVVVPLESQIAMTRQKWDHKRAFIVSKSPYVEGKTWEDTADILIDKKVDAVVLDCIGYTREDHREIAALLNLPVILPRTILSSAINRLF